MTATYNDKPISELPHPYLLNILAKLIREESDDAELIAALEAQKAANEERFARQRQRLESEGVSVIPVTGDVRGKPTEGFAACLEGGVEIANTFAKDEGAAWGKAYTILHGEG